MNKNILVIFFIGLALSGGLALSSCKKEATTPAPEPATVFTVRKILKIYPEHHGVPIPSQPWYPDSVHIKMDTLYYPGASPSLYDFHFTGMTGIDYVDCDLGVLTSTDSLREMYIYVTGFDTAYMINARVIGGIPYTIDLSDSTTWIQRQVPVTE